MKYMIETAHGAAIELWHYDEATWYSLQSSESSTIEDARREMAEAILSQINGEDRGEEYEREWEAAAERAKSAEVGDVVSFDERGWRIIEVGE